MWYEIERNLNSFIISNTGSKDLYLTLFLSEKCDIDVNYKVCIEEVIIEVGDKQLIIVKLLFIIICSNFQARIR